MENEVNAKIDLKQQNKELLEEIKRLVGCPKMRLYIFGENDDDMLAKKSLWKSVNYYKYINNAFNLTFMYVYACYRRMIDNVVDPDKVGLSSNAKRVFETLAKLYSGHSVTTELVQFVLMDLYIDINGDSSLSAYIPDLLQTSRKIDFHIYFRKIAEWQKTSRLDGTLVEMQSMFMRLLPALSFLHSVTLEGDKDFFIFKVKNWTDESEFYSNRTILLMDLGRRQKFYFLESLTVAEKKLYLSYNSIDGSASLSYIVSQEEQEESEGVITIKGNCGDVYNEITGQVNENLEPVFKGGFIEDIHTINYKYIKNLALTISDAMADDDKRNLYEKFYYQYPSIFSGYTGEFDVDKFNWDNVSIMLLIEAGPTKVLFELLCYNSRILKELLRKLSVRFDNNLSITQKNEKQLEGEVTALLDENNLSALVRRSCDERFRDKRKAEIRAHLIVESLNAFADNDGDRPGSYLNTWDINEIIATIDRLKKESDGELILKAIKEIMGGFFRRTICFYRGMLAYAAVRGSFEAKAYSRIMTHKETYACQQQSFEVFFKTAEEWARRLKSKEVPYSELLALCSDCAIQSDGGIKEDNKLLRYALGRPELVNSYDIKRLFPSVFDTDNSCRQNLDRLLEQSLQILHYFAVGGFVEKVGTIYPYIASYSRNVDNRDGYRTLTFVVGSEDGTSGDNREIKILTEFEYRINEKYYCLPNIARASDNWWIEPFAVSCRDFDAIFEENK